MSLLETYHVGTLITLLQNDWAWLLADDWLLCPRPESFQTLRCLSCTDSLSHPSHPLLNQMWNPPQWYSEVCVFCKAELLTAHSTFLLMGWNYMIVKGKYWLLIIIRRLGCSEHKYPVMECTVITPTTSWREVFLHVSIFIWQPYTIILLYTNIWNNKYRILSKQTNLENI